MRRYLESPKLKKIETLKKLESRRAPRILSILGVSKVRRELLHTEETSALSFQKELRAAKLFPKAGSMREFPIAETNSSSKGGIVTRLGQVSSYVSLSSRESYKELLHNLNKSMSNQSKFMCLVRECISKRGPGSQLSASFQTVWGGWSFRQWESTESNTELRQQRSITHTLSMLTLCMKRVIRRVVTLKIVCSKSMLEASIRESSPKKWQRQLEWATAKQRSILQDKINR